MNPFDQYKRHTLVHGQLHTVYDFGNRFYRKLSIQEIYDCRNRKTTVYLVYAISEGTLEIFSFKIRNIDSYPDPHPYRVGGFGGFNQIYSEVYVYPSRFTDTCTHGLFKLHELF